MKLLFVPLALIWSFLMLPNKSKGEVKSDIPAHQNKEWVARQISNQLIYPENAIRHQEEGKVRVTFIPLTDGSVNVVAVESDNPVLKRLIQQQLTALDTRELPLVSGKAYAIVLEFRLL